MPSPEEQMTAEQYVLERVLPRPATDYKKAIRCVIIYLASSFLTALVTFHLFNGLGIACLSVPAVAAWGESHPTAYKFLFFLLVYALSALCCLKKAVIGAIHLYQHYAPEDVRRRCLFMPTCSEYAIMAVQKYGVVIGLIKAYIRLFKKCRGSIYRIDYP